MEDISQGRDRDRKVSHDGKKDIITAMKLPST